MQDSHLSENGFSNGSLGKNEQDWLANKKTVNVPAYFKHRAHLDRVLGAVLLTLLSPVIAITALAVRSTSPGPALFRQRRLGKSGRDFFVLKLRTMYIDAEHLSGPAYCQPGDARITPVGRLLRFLHLDELPQLTNVVKGEMCLIGPRPERPEIIKIHELNERVPGFSERTKVLPGITGLAQINLPPDLSVDCVIPKVELDLEYIDTANFSLDLRILLCTAMRMVGVRHGIAVKLLGLCRKVSLGQELPRKRLADKAERDHLGVHKPSDRVPQEQLSHAVCAVAGELQPSSNGTTDVGYSMIDESNKSAPNDPIPNRPR